MLWICGPLSLILSSWPFNEELSQLAADSNNTVCCGNDYLLVNICFVYTVVGIVEPDMIVRRDLDHFPFHEFIFRIGKRQQFFLFLNPVVVAAVGLFLERLMVYYLQFVP